jgi:hypothetical protein
MNKISNVFIAHAFAEFKEQVAYASELINDSTLLHTFGIFPHHLGKMEAYANTPITQSLTSVREARYVICLIGESLGSEAENDKTYLELEIKEALVAEKEGVLEGVFIFLTGDKYEVEWRERQERNELAPEVCALLVSLRFHSSTSIF